jgi:hypothetical protein
VDALPAGDQLDSDQFRSGQARRCTGSTSVGSKGAIIIHPDVSSLHLHYTSSRPVLVSLHYYYSSTEAKTRKIPNGLVVGVDHGLSCPPADYRAGLAALRCAAVPAAAKPQRKQSRQRTVQGTEDGTRTALFLRRSRTNGKPCSLTQQIPSPSSSSTCTLDRTSWTLA